MTIASYLVLVPYNNAPPLLAEHPVDGVIDPFIAKLDPLALFPIQQWALDVEQTLNIGSQGTGAGAGKVFFNPFSITRKFDKASPELFLRACSGTPFEFVDLIQHKSEPKGAGETFLAWRFQLVAVKTVAWVEHAASPMETITFEYGGLIIDYYTQAASGRLRKLYHGGWDRIRNVKIP